MYSALLSLPARQHPARQRHSKPLGGTLSPRRCWVVVTFAPLLQPARPKHRCSWAKMVRKFQVFLLAPGNTSYGAPQRLQHKQDPQPQRWICSIWARNVQVPASFLKMRSILGMLITLLEVGGCYAFSTVLLSVLFKRMRKVCVLHCSDSFKCPSRTRTWKSHLCHLFPFMGTGQKPDALPTVKPLESHVFGPWGACDAFLTQVRKTPVFVRPSPCSDGPQLGMRAPKPIWRDNRQASARSFGWDLWSGKTISHTAWGAVSLCLVRNGERTQHFLAFPAIPSSPSFESMTTLGSAESTGQGNLVYCFPVALGDKNTL